MDFARLYQISAFPPADHRILVYDFCFLPLATFRIVGFGFGHLSSAFVPAHNVSYTVGYGF